jgi:hypothetical protein
VRESSSPAPPIGDRTPHHRFDPPQLDRRLTREPIGFHVTLRLEDDRPIATTPAALRVVARVVLGKGKRADCWQSALRMITFMPRSRPTARRPAHSLAAAKDRRHALQLHRQASLMRH